ncbi:hypothetical protein K470DRAFT_261632 [Piedraia hortae CBS 480.64]|uniref:Calponin-homology (CH) domain-containing protein n=1 Tax=Piedraia hortae CBS 480.64 TaxID=1314780 RepID=A0A6A7CAZ5_9PEZI|nr:hypothetical protein K470DRAFT_261632 [Piedraia hortae CBS 480.64]
MDQSSDLKNLSSESCCHMVCIVCETPNLNPLPTPLPRQPTDPNTHPRAKPSIEQTPLSKIHTMATNLHLAFSPLKPNMNMSPVDRRRRTIYIPPDSTTAMLTIHPGAKDKTLDDTWMFPIAKRPNKRSPKKADAVKPTPQRRTPLGTITPKPNNTNCTVDIPGQGGGKENLLPDANRNRKKSFTKAGLLDDTFMLPSAKRPNNRSSKQEGAAKPPHKRVPLGSITPKPTHTNHKVDIPGQGGEKDNLLPDTKRKMKKPSVSAKVVSPADTSAFPRPLKQSVTAKPSQTRTPQSPQNPKPTCKSTTTIPSQNGGKKETFSPPAELIMTITTQNDHPKPAALHPPKESYQPLPHIPHPSLYTPLPHWLSHQEVSLREIINTLLTPTAQPPPPPRREPLLKIYHTPTTVTLHTRLEQSLRYGTLAPAKPVHLSTDLGIREAFLSLLEVYEEGWLRAAAEVVVGRTIPPSVRVRAFLKRFFVEGEWWVCVLRALMVIWVLDRGGIKGGLVFRCEGGVKASREMIVRLGKVVIPSTGDLVRRLGFLGFEVGFVQDEDEDWGVKDLAVGVRDGVLLGRLGVVLFGGKGVGGQCRTRRERLGNTQRALDGLREKGVDVSGVQAEDLVDGHRERTLSLLWRIVCPFGLNKLVGEGLAGEGKLMEWAEGYYGSALTTEMFAECGREVYEAILDGFGEFISGQPAGLADKLAAIGCSKTFVSQLTAKDGFVPSRHAVIANLAFLASRLLHLAKTHKSAVKISRAYRLMLARRQITRRLALCRLAHSCAAVVRTQHRLVEATTVLQRAWRAVMDARVKRLENDVMRFQTIARTWLVRHD